MSKQLSVNLEEKFYEGSSIQILKDCNFKVNPGEFVTILGPSGCGKSMLLKMIVGIDKRFKGSLSLGERQVEGPSTNCSIIFQESRLMPWMTVRENVAFAVNVAYEHMDKEIFELLDFLNLKDFAYEYPLSLSGGMAQKVALARAMINLPDLLLLDEPFASLDYITRMQLQKELVKVLKQKKITVLMVTHDIEEAIFCSDRILVMSHKPGKIITNFKVTLPKPRERASDDFLSLYKQILTYMSEKLDLI